MNEGILDVKSHSNNDHVVLLRSTQKSGGYQVQEWDGFKWKKYNAGGKKLAHMNNDPPSFVVITEKQNAIKVSPGNDFERLPGNKCTKHVAVGKVLDSEDMYRLNCVFKPGGYQIEKFDKEEEEW